MIRSGALSVGLAACLTFAAGASHSQVAPVPQQPSQSAFSPAPAPSRPPLPSPAPPLKPDDSFTKPQPPLWSWGPPGIDQAPSAITDGVTCQQQQVLDGVAQRLNELLDNISQFDAVEEVVHEEQDKTGRMRTRDRRKFAYLGTISRLPSGAPKIEEDRQSMSVSAGFPGAIATIGLPTLAFAFHPSIRDSFDMNCEGLGAWRTQPTWLIRFQQREDRPRLLQSYNIGNRLHPVALQGRAWIDASTFQIVHVEAELVRPMPQIELLRHHQVVDYGMVTFKKGNTEMWLPKKAELYFYFRGHRYYRRHNFDEFRLFSVDVAEKVTLPAGQNP
jgi:hypothetical protein